jgi:hypothetical protein
VFVILPDRAPLPFERTLRDASILDPNARFQILDHPGLSEFRYNADRRTAHGSSPQLCDEPRDHGVRPTYGVVTMAQHGLPSQRSTRAKASITFEPLAFPVG